MDKLYQTNLEQNVNGRKKVNGLDYTVANPLKRLQDRFSSILPTRKKSAPVPSVPHATRSATATTNVVKIASSKKSIYDDMTRSTPGKKKD